MTSRISGWCITPATGRFTAAVRLLGYVDCLSRVPSDWYARFCEEGVIAISPPYPTSYPLPALCGFPQPGFRVAVAALHRLGETMHTAFGGPRLVDQASHTLAAVLTETLENPSTF